MQPSSLLALAALSGSTVMGLALPGRETSGDLVRQGQRVQGQVEVVDYKTCMADQLVRIRTSRFPIANELRATMIWGVAHDHCVMMHPIGAPPENRIPRTPTASQLLDPTYVPDLDDLIKHNLHKGSYSGAASPDEHRENGRKAYERARGNGEGDGNGSGDARETLGGNLQMFVDEVKRGGVGPLRYFGRGQARKPFRVIGH